MRINRIVRTDLLLGKIQGKTWINQLLYLIPRILYSRITLNKKVLLREPSAVLSWEGYSIVGLGGRHPWLGTPSWGTPRKDMAPVKVLWDGDGVPPRVDGQTLVKTVPSRRTT